MEESDKLGVDDPEDPQFTIFNDVIVPFEPKIKKESKLMKIRQY